MRIFEDEQNDSNEQEEQSVFNMTSNEFKHFKGARLLKISEFKKFKNKIAQADKDAGFQGAWWLDDWTYLYNPGHKMDNVSSDDFSRSGAKNESYVKYKTELFNGFRKKKKDKEENTEDNNEQQNGKTSLNINQKTMDKIASNIWIYRVVNGEIEKPKGRESNKENIAIVRPVLIFDDFSGEENAPDLSNVTKVNLGTKNYSFTLLGKNDEGKILVLCDTGICRSMYFNINEQWDKKEDSRIYTAINKFVEIIKSSAQKISDEESKNKEDEERRKKDSEVFGDEYKKSKAFMKYFILFKKKAFWKVFLSKLKISIEEELNKETAKILFNALQTIKNQFKEEGNEDLFNDGNKCFLQLILNELNSNYQNIKCYKQIKTIIEWMDEDCPEDDMYEEIFQDNLGFSYKKLLKNNKDDSVVRQGVKKSDAIKKKKKKESRVPGSRTTLFEDRSEKGFWEMLSE